MWTSLYTYFFKSVLSTASHLFFKSRLHSHGAAREITSSEMSRRLRASRVCPPAWCATKESSSTRPPPPPPHIPTRAILRMYQWPLRTLRAKLLCGRTSGGDAIVPCGRCLRNPAFSRFTLADSRNRNSGGPAVWCVHEPAVPEAAALEVAAHETRGARGGGARGSGARGGGARSGGARGGGARGSATYPLCTHFFVRVNTDNGQMFRTF